MQYSILGKGRETEYLVIEIWGRKGSFKTVHFYKPRKMLSTEWIDILTVYLGGDMIWCGDFNAHSTLWGDHENVMVIEDLMESKKTFVP